MKNFSLFILIITSLLSCTKERIEGNHNLVTEQRMVSNFTKVTSEGQYIVYINNDNDYSLTIDAEENLLPFIETTIINNELIIREKSTFYIRPNYPVKIFVTCPTLSKSSLCGSGQMYLTDFSGISNNTSLSGSGEIYFTNCNFDISRLNISGSGDINGELTTNDLVSDISGSGSINLIGNSNYSEYNITGSGDINGAYFTQNYCEVKISGSGNVSTQIDSSLTVKITGSGDVFYIGNPQINASVTGSGKISKVNN